MRDSVYSHDLDSYMNRRAVYVLLRKRTDILLVFVFMQLDTQRHNTLKHWSTFEEASEIKKLLKSKIEWN